MIIYSEFFKKVVDFCSESEKMTEFIKKYGYITAVTNMSICHFNDNIFYATFKIWIKQPIFKFYTEFENNHIVKSDISLHIKTDIIQHAIHNNSLIDTFLCIAKLRFIDNSFVIDTIVIKRVFFDIPDHISDKMSFVDVRICKYDENNLMMIGNHADNKTYIINYNIELDMYELIHIYQNGKNVPFILNSSNNLVLYDFYNSFSCCLINIKTKNAVNMYNNAKNIKKNSIYLTTENIYESTLSGSTNIIKIGETYFCIFHKYILIYNDPAFIEFPLCRSHKMASLLENICTSSHDLSFDGYVETGKNEIIYILTKDDVKYVYHRCGKITKNSDEITLDSYVKDTYEFLKTHYSDNDNRDQIINILYNIDKYNISYIMHRLGAAIYFSYIAELRLYVDYMKIVKISPPIYIKTNCTTGVHYICGFTYDGKNVYISYGINDFDSNVIITSIDKMKEIIEATHDNIYFI